MTAAQRRLYVLSIALAAAPFAFAFTRAVNSRHHDLRMLWMALAAGLAAMVVMAVGRAWNRAAPGVLALSALALVAATLCAGWTARWLGASAAAGIWPVAFVLAFCWATSFGLRALSRRGA